MADFKQPSDEAIEAAARQLFDWESGKDSVAWEDEDELVREQVRDAVLTVGRALYAIDFPEYDKLREALEYCVRDCCARPWDEVGDGLVLSADPCESCERAVAALAATWEERDG